jgi:hypothetical protein
VAYHREKTAAFMARISSLNTTELLRVYQQMVCGSPTDEILRQLGPP